MTALNVLARDVAIDYFGTRRVSVTCPWCEGRHLHEWPMGEPPLLLRVSPCEGAVAYLIQCPTFEVAEWVEDDDKAAGGDPR